MHTKASDNLTGPAVVPVRFIMEDPAALVNDPTQSQIEVQAAIGQNILEIAIANGINLEHACGGVCACSTCHVYLEEGSDLCSDAQEDEEDRVEEAPGLQENSRLSCQTIVQKEGLIVIRIPAWNRNAVKEGT